MRRISTLTPSEWRIMNLLWDKAPRTVTELVSELSATTGWSKHTVISFLGRMEQKGTVGHRQGPRAKEYFPLRRRDYAQMAETESFLDRVYNGSPGRLIAALADSGLLTESDFEILSNILETEWKKEKKALEMTEML